ncbi:amino acid permease [Cristinia sonorae]|uniref:Amino acid permease n=1 Tax=Cristinia sonorae TaxID=1940300 RepID=A0A8K0UXU3_9AGAR|nr:amino acid permease [Cristinia sonorae]
MSSEDYDLKRDPEKLHSELSSVDATTAAPDFSNGLRRKLKNRHISMISIGVIGTGLFLGTASGLQNGGPVGLLLGYAFIGSICYAVMTSLGEMVAYLPLPGGHITMAERFVEPAMSFAMGWNYWYVWTIILPAELAAGAVLVNYWTKVVPNAAWIAIFLVGILAVNLLGAGAYGEAEFFFASIKVITIVGLIILGIVLDLGGGPSHDRIGFRYWKNPGPFVQYAGIPGAKGRFLAFWGSLTQAAFSYIGTEVVAIAGGEAKNPRRNIPKAIKRVYVRMALFYLGGVTVIGLLVPSSHPDLSLKTSDAAKSPFVIAIRAAGIKGLPSVINAAILTSALSAGVSDLYCSSRAIYGLAATGNAPKIFMTVTKRGVPWIAVLFQASFGLLAFMCLSDGPGKVFGWFGNMTSIAGLVSWSGICMTYIRFHAGMKAQGMDRRKLPYISRFQPYTAYYGAIVSIFICITCGWNVFLRGNWATDSFVTNYIPLVLFPVMFIVAKLWRRTSLIEPANMDFKTGLAEVEAASYDEPPPRNRLEAFWQWLM